MEEDCVPNLWELTADVVSKIPRGKVVTFGEIARWYGDIQAARWLGEWARNHLHSSDCMCHRLVRSTGELGGYINEVNEKVLRLQEEQVAIVDDRVDLQSFAYQLPANENPPLLRLRAYQHRAAESTRIEPLATRVKTVGGIDLSYRPHAHSREAVVTLACVDAESAELQWSESLSVRVNFPYITSYLAFRELPSMLKMIEHVRRKRALPDLLLVDGSGCLHPRRAGIAVMLGVESQLPTIGVSKKRLVGKYDEQELLEKGNSAVFCDDEECGYAMLPKTKSQRACFTSPGFGVSVKDARIYARRMLCAHRIPEPIYWADRISRQRATSE